MEYGGEVDREDDRGQKDVRRPRGSKIKPGGRRTGASRRDGMMGWDILLPRGSWQEVFAEKS